jgi:competence protein ComEC
LFNFNHLNLGTGIALPSFMLDPGLLLGLAVLAGQRAQTCWFGALLLLLLGLKLTWNRISKRWSLLILISFLISTAAARVTLVQADQRREQVRQQFGAPQRCEARAKVISSPTQQGKAWRWFAQLSEMNCGTHVLPGTFQARLYSEDFQVQRAEHYLVTLSLAPVELFHNHDLPDPRPGAARQKVTLSGSVVVAEKVVAGRGLASRIDQLRNYVRTRIESSYLPDAQPLARALVLGENDLNHEDDEAFKKSGLAHLLAVSGSHLVVVVLGVVGAIQGILRRVYTLASRIDVGRVSALVGVFVALFYADFAGNSGSSWRAALMMAAMLGARALGRQGQSPRALGLSFIGMSLVDPLVAYDISFLLSAAATSGLLIFSKPIGNKINSYLPSYLHWLGEALGTTLGASIACAPFLSILAPQLPLAGLVANVVAVPIGELLALPICLSHTLLGWFPLAERGCAMVGSGTLLAVRAIAHVSSKPTFAVVPVPMFTAGQFVTMGAAALVLAFRPSWKRLPILALALAGMLSMEAQAICIGNPSNTLRITFMDVGQGDGALLDFPNGQSMVVDAGGFVGSPVNPGERVLLPLLRSRRRRAVDVVVLSHPHPDHFLGLATALPKLSVGEFWDSGQGESEGAGFNYPTMMNDLKKRGVPVRYPKDLCNRIHYFGKVSVRVFAPCPGFVPFANPNDNSLVLQIKYGKHKVLMVGDAEHEEEQELLVRYGHHLQSTILKVGHHGSKTSSSPAFLKQVHPKLAVISTGLRNRFGHPHPRTLHHLLEAGIPVVRTDQGGSLQWQSNGEQMQWTRAHRWLPSSTSWKHRFFSPI